MGLIEVFDSPRAKPSISWGGHVNDVLPPDTVALSAIGLPTIADPGCWLVLIDGIGNA
jgi:hypothetical protein